MTKTYKVTATAKYQSWNGTGRTIEVTAASAKEAISRARRQVWIDGTFSKEDGAITYRAERVLGNYY